MVQTCGTTPNFRHNTVKTVTYTASGKNGVTSFKLPVDGRANFVFLDGHAKSLDVGTAFQESKDSGGNYVEDGFTLDSAAAPNEATTPYGYKSHYTLWNIY